MSPLFKSGDPTVPSNYRPVSLLPIVSRLLERVVKEQVDDYLSKHTCSLLPVTQFAYRPNHSTEDALVLAVNRWQEAKFHRKTTGLIMVDMSKAFDRARHDTLVAKLHSLGIHGNGLAWFCSYLSSRRQRAKVGRTISAETVCSRGVPQGSVLGPLLFVLYTCGIGKVLPSGIRHQEFADDIIIDYSHPDPERVAQILSQGVTVLANWLDALGLLLNSKKTQVMFIKPRGLLSVDSNIFCRNERLVTVSSARYLGVTIDDELNWKLYLSQLSLKSRQATGQLWRRRCALSFPARRSWYLAMIQSNLCYGSNAIYPSLGADGLKRIEKMAKSGIRAVFGLRNPVATQPLRCLLNVSTLETLFGRKILVFVYRTLSSLSSSLFLPYFTLVSQQADSSCRATRGQDSRILCVPFLPGPAGRSLISFKGSVVWNNLPAAARLAPSKASFQEMIANC